MICSIELTGHQAGSQAAEGSTHLVAAGGEPLTGHGNDAAGNTGQSAGNLHVIGHSLEQTALLLGLIVPGNTEQVHGIHIPQPGLGELGLDLLGDQVGVLHLGDGGNDDVVFLCLLDIMLQAGLVDGQIDHCLFSSCFFTSCWRQYKNTVYIWKYRSILPLCHRIWSPGTRRSH